MLSLFVQIQHILSEQLLLLFQSVRRGQATEGREEAVGRVLVVVVHGIVGREHAAIDAEERDDAVHGRTHELCGGGG